MNIIDCEQGSPEWFRARMGIPTASMFATVMAKGKNGGKSLTREAYMHKLAGEILTGEPMESYTNADMERGKLMEDEARDAYVFQTGAELQRVGFVMGDDCGASPDSVLVQRLGGLELKSAAPHVQVERLLQDRLPPEHVAQVQGTMWVCRCGFWDFVSYCPRLPLLIVRVQRDEGYIANLAGAVKQFNDELAAIVERVRAYGRKEAA
jgi:hypothetical protein